MFNDEMRVDFKRMYGFSTSDGVVEITESVGDTMRDVANEPSVSDEMRVDFKMMHEFSTSDRVVEITESVGDTMRYVANEPSVGLFFIQRHIENAAPNLIKLKNKISSKSHKTTLHTEDLDDCMKMIKSVKQCGNPIVDEMIKNINESLKVISTKQPKKGLVSSPGSSFQGPRSYTSSVLSSPSEINRILKWPLFDSNKWGQIKDERAVYYSNPLEVEANELPLSRSSNEREKSSSSSSHIWVPLLEKSYDDVRVDREAKLEDWLGAKTDEASP